MSRRPFALLAVLGVALGGASLAACGEILGIETLTNAPDAGADGPVLPDAGPEACVPFHPPERPDAGDDDGGPGLLFASKSIVLALEKSSQADIAWDLDDHCTCIDLKTPEACVRPKNAGTETCDKSGGRDMTGNSTILQANVLVSGISDGNLQKQLDLGKFGVLISARGYSGQPNDPKIRVDVTPSYGTVLTNDAGAPILNSSGYLQNAPLLHDGTDRWGFIPEYASKGADGLLDATSRDDNAYVKDGVAVAHFDSMFLAVQFSVGNTNPLLFRVQDVIVSAKIVPQSGGGFTLEEGRIGGRARIADMMRAFLVWEDPTGGDVCEGSITYEAIRGGLCKNRDIRSSRVDDHKALDCDAISFAVGFSAEPARIYGSVNYVYKKAKCWDGTLPLGPAPGDPCQ